MECEAINSESLEGLTAKANSLREQFKPYLIEKSIKKLSRSKSIGEFTNLKFKITQKYLDLKNRTNITLRNLINKVNNGAKYSENILPSHPYSFNDKMNKKKSEVQPTNNLFSLTNTFKIDDKVIRTISKEDLDYDTLNCKINENEIIMKQIEDNQIKLQTINEILEEMEQVNQEVIFEEDKKTVEKAEYIKQLEADQKKKMNEINLKRLKLETDLNQCSDLYKSLKIELNAIGHKKNNLKAQVNEMKRNYAEESMILKNLNEKNCKKLKEIHEKIFERRERDLAIIKAFRLRKIEIAKNLEEKENLMKKNYSISTNSFKNIKNCLNEEKDDDAYNEYNQVEEFNPESFVKMKYFKKLETDFRICIKDTVLSISLNERPKYLKGFQSLKETEGIEFVDENFENTDVKFKIGKGLFSKIYLAKSSLYKTLDKKLIIKHFKFEKKKTEKYYHKNGFKICSYLTKYPNKNLVELFNVYEMDISNGKKNYLIVEEYCLSNLAEIMNDIDTNLIVEDIKIIADCLASALFYLHCNGIAHLNVNPQSIFINEKKSVKLGNLESCVICFSHKNNCFIDQPTNIDYLMDEDFIAPEIKTEEKFDPIKADVYSYGLILAYCYKRKPFNDQEVDINESASSLIENCLNENPDNRYSLYNVLTHCYFN